MAMRRTLRTLLGVFGVLLLTGGMAYAAQEGGEAEVHTKSLLDLFKATGIVGILLLLLSIVGTALLIQFMVNITEEKLANPALLSEVEALLMDNDVDGAFTLSESDSSYAGKVLAGAIGRSSGGFEETKKGAEETAAVESFRLNAKISLLSLVGNIGPLLGLLGTVTGMIASFQVIETLKSPTPKDLAVGVYESLVNTTMGLFISIVFLSAFFFLKNKVSDVTLRINNAIGEMLSRTLSPEARAGAGK
jgi:biopolymer transport protein ExbB